MDTRWEPAFVAIGALIGEPEDVAPGLSEGTDGAEGSENAGPAIEGSAETASREARAVMIARALSDVAFALDAWRLA